MLTELGRKTIVRVAKRSGRYGKTFPETWAKVRSAWSRCEVGACPFDMINKDEAWINGKKLAQNAWHAGRAEVGLMPVDLI